MVQSEKTVITATVRNILFQNRSNSFTVLTLIDTSGTLFRATGILGPVREGDELEIEGTWVINPRYGRSFKIVRYDVRLPTTTAGIQSFLASGYIKGIGPKMAREIVAVFGDETLRILDEEPERLLGIPSIGRKRLQAMVEGWKEHAKVRGSLLFLQSLQLTPGVIQKVIQKFGNEAALKIRENPYSLTEISGIGFVKADQCAKNSGISPESPERLQAGVLHILKDSLNQGHCFISDDAMLELSQALLNVPRELIASQIEVLIRTNKIIRKFHLEESVLVRPDIDKMEQGITRRIREIFQAPGRTGNKLLMRTTADIEGDIGFTLSDDQRNAFELFRKSKVLVITGGPGTGKTTLVRAIISLCRSQFVSIKLAAPTGRASQRLQETTGAFSQTIHRLLEFNPAFGAFTRHEKNVIDADIVLIDESSMLDIFLMYSLLNALSNNTHLVLVGDVDQLPSVGPGMIFKDILESRKVPQGLLSLVLRQAADSSIISNAHRINRGEMPDLSNKEGSDFYFIERNDPKGAADTILELVTTRIPQAFNFHRINDIQVLTPMHGGEVGADELNFRIQKAVNQNAAEGGRFSVGDKVIQTKNNYNKGENGIFNGDIGLVTTVDPKKNSATVDFGESICYASEELAELSLAYAITIHKSQGSEFPVVLFPLLTQHFMLLQRNLVYTALTRARKLVVIVGSKRALQIAVGNDKPTTRNTGLKDLLHREVF